MDLKRGLKCVSVLLEGNRRPREILFIVSPEEEARISARLQEYRGGAQIVLSASLSLNLGQDVVDSEILELRRLLRPGVRLAVGVGPIDSVRLAEWICEAKVMGIPVETLDSALLELDPSLHATSSEVIRQMSSAGSPLGRWVRGYSALKHAAEPLLAAVLLIFLSPLILLVATLVKATSPGPIFYRQTRLGHRRELFDIIKFRSMRVDAEKDGPVWASASRSDARLTPIGGFLRATHLDEIPQIWNVVRGELSFIGPRPERPIFCQELEREIPLFRLRTWVKPGITGWAQVRAGYANSVSDSQRKLEFDLYYVLRQSPALDLRIILDTLAILFTGGSEGRKRERTRKVGFLPRTVLSKWSVNLKQSPMASLNAMGDVMGDAGGNHEKSQLVNAEIS